MSLDRIHVSQFRSSSRSHTFYHHVQHCSGGMAFISMPYNLNTTKEKFSSYELDLELMCGQCYNGADKYRAKRWGAATLITRQHMLALYLHWTSQRLNVAVISGLHKLQISCSRHDGRGVCRSGTLYDSHPERQLAIENSINKKEPEIEEAVWHMLPHSGRNHGRPTYLSEGALISRDMRGEHLRRRPQEFAYGFLERCNWSTAGRFHIGIGHHQQVFEVLESPQLQHPDRSNCKGGCAGRIVVVLTHLKGFEEQDWTTTKLHASGFRRLSWYATR